MSSNEVFSNVGLLPDTGLWLHLGIEHCIVIPSNTFGHLFLFQIETLGNLSNSSRVLIDLTRLVDQTRQDTSTTVTTNDDLRSCFLALRKDLPKDTCILRDHFPNMSLGTGGHDDLRDSPKASLRIGNIVAPFLSFLEATVPNTNDNRTLGRSRVEGIGRSSASSVGRSSRIFIGIAPPLWSLIR